MRATVLCLLATILLTTSLFADQLTHSKEVDHAINSYLNGNLSQDQKALLKHEGINPDQFRGTDNAGGPDDFGYLWIDSEEDDLDYEWFDITPDGAIIDDLGDDDIEGPFDIGFDFPFYGEMQTEFYVNSNGTIVFDWHLLSFANFELPSAHDFGYISLLWDDLDPGDDQDLVYYANIQHEDMNALVISFIDYDHYPGEGDNEITMQVILREDGCIIMQYASMTEDFLVSSCTIGIQGSPTVASQVLYNGSRTNYPYENLAIKYYVTVDDAIVTGTITDSQTGNPIPDVAVRIYNRDTVTDENGFYELTDLVNGFLTFHSFILGYWSLEEEIFIHAGTNTYDIQLDSYDIPVSDDWPYFWVDISETGTPIAHGSNVSELVLFADYELDSFDYFGVEYNEINVCSNGFASFTSNSTTSISQELPDMTNPDATLALCWMDMQNSFDDELILVDNVDNQLVITYQDVSSLGTNGITLNAQIILDFVTGQIFYNYQSIELENPAYTSTHSVGYENETGEYGESIFYGMTWDYPQSESSYFIGTLPGVLTGIVADVNSLEPLEECEVSACLPGTAEIVRSTITDEEGVYHLNLPEGLYDVYFERFAYNTISYENIELTSGETEVLDVLMGDPVNPVTVHGTITSFENPTVRVPNVIVTMYTTEGELVGTTTANALGDYVIGNEDIQPGNYTFNLTHDPVGSGGYHDATFENVEVPAWTGEVDLQMNEILPPENLFLGDMNPHVLATWDVPANNATVNLEDIERLRARATANINNPEKQQYYQSQLSQLERQLERNQNFTDELSDLQQFILVDGNYDEIATIPYTGDHLYSYLIEELNNCEIYYFAVAADYGYGEDNLVYSELDSIVLHTQTSEFIEVDYDWVDVRNNPDAVVCELGDDSEIWVDFPFPFYFFGSEYDGITIGANGAASFLPDVEIPYSNSALPGPMPGALLAPFWTDFNPAGDDAWDVFYIIDENDILWIEWYMPYYQTTSLANFEIMIDLNTSDIIFQYNFADYWDDTATIGFQDESRTVGTMAFIQDLIDAEGEYALQVFIDGNIFPARYSGYVYDSSGNPLEDVEIVENNNVVTRTNANGYYWHVYWPRDFNLQFVADGYLPDSLSFTLFICEDRELEDIVLNRVQGSVDPDEINIDIFISAQDPDIAGSRSVTLSNSGDLPLEWNANLELLDFPGNWEFEYTIADNFQERRNDFSGRIRDNSCADLSPIGPLNQNFNNTDELWDYIFGFSLTGTTGAVGAVTTDECVYVTEWGYQGNFGFYEFDLDGNQIRAEVMPADMEGVRDLAWDGEYLYGGNVNNGGNIYRFNPDDLNDYELLYSGTEMGRGIALNSETGDLYISNWSTLGKLTNVGGVYEFEALEYPVSVNSCYGLAWMPYDQDDMNLWIFAQPGANGVLYRYNTETAEVDEGFEIYGFDDGDAGGIDISDSYNQSMLTITTVLQTMPACVDVWEGTSSRRWFNDFISLENRSGEISAGESDDIVMTYNLEDSEELYNCEQIETGDQIEAVLHITNPYWSGADIPVVITMWIDDVKTEETLLPEEYALHQNYPNPFNPLTTINFDLVETLDVRLSVYNILGQNVETLINQKVEAGYHTATFDATKLSSGIYFYRIETEAFNDLKKMVLVK